MKSLFIPPAGSFPLPLDRLSIFPEPEPCSDFADHAHAQFAQRLPRGVQFFVRSLASLVVHGQQLSMERVAWRTQKMGELNQ